MSLSSCNLTISLERIMMMQRTSYLWFFAIVLSLFTQTDPTLGECCQGCVALQPHFLQPKVKHLELFPGNGAALTCEVYRNLTSCNLPPSEQPRYSLQIWWCNSTYPACYKKVQLAYNPLYISQTTSSTKNASYLNATLNLTDLAPSQSGDYYCVAYSQDQYTTGNTGYVGVYVDIQARSPVKITYYTNASELFEGAPLILNCTADGYPTPSFRWEKDSASIAGGQNGMFYVKKTTKTDTGNYICIAENKIESVRSGNIVVKVNSNGEDISWGTKVGLIVAAVFLVGLLTIAIVLLKKRRYQQNCCPINRTTVIGDNNKTFLSVNTVNIIQNSGGSHFPAGNRASIHERRTFLHMHDVFIHNHSSDVQFAELIRSKLQDRQSHLNVGLWSEMERPDRSSSLNKVLRLHLLNCTRIVIITSEEYLKYGYHAFTSALAKSRARPESIRSKMIIIRVLEESKIPKSLSQDVMATLDYNVETDSCYFWPRFVKVAIPDQRDILYWA